MEKNMLTTKLPKNQKKVYYLNIWDRAYMKSVHLMPALAMRI